MAAGHNETELVRTLKQIIELRGLKQQRRSSAATDTVTLFGKKLSVGGGGGSSLEESSTDKIQLSEKLPPSAIVHLKELYEQRLKRKAAPCHSARSAENGDALTLPLLGSIQDVGIKRQRIGVQAAAATEDVRPIFYEIQSDLAAEKERAEVAKGAPLTLFYNGMVYVFDDVTDDMAQAIMILAGNATCSSASHTEKFLASAAKDAKPAAAMPSFTLADLPQARKASLHRFLEKRKDRLFAKSDKESVSSSKPKTPPRSPPRKQHHLLREMIQPPSFLQIY
ncbi:hypothetical protein SELMODRAFT_439249 [Selaginella moellendorffii]|uniref:Tify domain-containing protein n=1 Tax=Selaginella moellendorffii TaxID=88036 RepID=D8R329_SELML|nr:protein TIFY 10c isoform X1 [Selaginella moellendorffii]EFJ32873.1 hypothetical protein SELMODRAFT_439249 [Selaginella moellendorffii]|eukprot:XP_002965453.1 protein TIFY 10c isoform X1 [Selaginella moellendorffii]